MAKIVMVGFSSSIFPSIVMVFGNNFIVCILIGIIYFYCQVDGKLGMQ